MTDTRGFEMALAEKDARLESLSQQLAAALAACKLKDEALLAWSNLKTIEWLRLSAKALAIQPDDSALKAWLGEPVARLLRRVGEEQYQPEFGMVARTYGELPKESYPDTWQELDELYSPKGLS